MKANRCARATRPAPDGGQMLLLAGFILAGAVIVAIGTYSVIQRTEGEITRAHSSEMTDLFLNTRTRAISFFGLIAPEDTNTSVQQNLDGYLSAQYRTARSLSLDLNISLASEGSPARNVDEEAQSVSGGTYTLSAHDGSESYTCVAYDGTNDGLITNADEEVLAAILWMRVRGPQGDIEEVVVIDVPTTESGC